MIQIRVCVSHPFPTLLSLRKIYLLETQSVIMVKINLILSNRFLIYFFFPSEHGPQILTTYTWSSFWLVLKLPMAAWNGKEARARQQSVWNQEKNHPPGVNNPLYFMKSFLLPHRSAQTGEQGNADWFKWPRSRQGVTLQLDPLRGLSMASCRDKAPTCSDPSAGTDWESRLWHPASLPPEELNLSDQPFFSGSLNK